MKMTYQETDLKSKIKGYFESASIDPSHSTALHAFDQYHAGGIAAVDLLSSSLNLTAKDIVLDVGSGFGGPARRIAEQTGARVVGIDITESYVEIANWLTQICSLDNTVSFENVDISDFRSGVSFDAAITMHVQMNVADKSSWFRQISEHLGVEGRLGIWEVCRTGTIQPTWPMPWSIDGTDSFLVTPSDLEAGIVSAGFETLEWEDATAWVIEWFTGLQFGGPQVGPSLLDDGFTRVINYASALESGTIEVRRGLFAKRDG